MAGGPLTTMTKAVPCSSRGQMRINRLRKDSVLKGMGFQLKGTGFQPVHIPRKSRGLQAPRECDLGFPAFP